MKPQRRGESSSAIHIHKAKKVRRRTNQSQKVTKIPHRERPRSYSLEQDSNSRHGPAGYVFVRKGNAFVSRKCKALTLERKRVVYNVLELGTSSSKIGIKIPSQIYEEVCQLHDSTKDERERIRVIREQRTSDKALQRLQELFPQMPEKDAGQIIERGWEACSGRVGRTSVIDLVTRLHLATWAHIRHQYTHYDEMFKENDVASQPLSLEQRTKIFRQKIQAIMEGKWLFWGGDKKAIGRNSAEEC